MTCLSCSKYWICDFQFKSIVWRNILFSTSFDWFSSKSLTLSFRASLNFLKTHLRNCHEFESSTENPKIPESQSISIKVAQEPLNNLRPFMANVTWKLSTCRLNIVPVSFITCYLVQEYEKNCKTNDFRRYGFFPLIPIYGYP